ncbi:acyl-coenzyme A thioesterase 9, mitochondrial-like isoform X2 [Anguilla rostrata]|uniref:acyl-CoA thioesterase 9, tandem duplicate 1 isoform X2 n=1 Tax=Anguilla anguilla TaxID=7936 RepID=UPI0015B0F0AD|nr:acyl-CoA thioesterase 9, tandem duplicate 1 isoform X2 [Anguilla anguilla]
MVTRHICAEVHYKFSVVGGNSPSFRFLHISVGKLYSVICLGVSEDMLPSRFQVVRTASSLMARPLCLGSRVLQGKAPDMAEVRNRLRETVGASTNWGDHQQAMAERASLSSQLARSQDELPVRRMKDSYIEVHLPLGTQPDLREKYLTYHNSVRFGRILEDLDSLAVLICYSHTKNDALPRSPLSIVTALVDKIDMRKHIIYPDCDIKFTGHVTWVGKTSIEAKMFMSQFYDGAYSPVLDATFVMVARDPENKRAAYVNPLKSEGLEEEKLLQEGEANKKRRVELSTASLLKVAPTAEERMVIHSLFLNTLDSKTVSFRSRVLPPNSVWMEDAKMKGLEICHPQERNIFNRIFGGFLMRKAYELGWANACGYGGCRPNLVAVDDILFQKPVEIGSLLLLSSQVCYTQDKYIQVRVHTEVLDPLTGQHNTTNIFHFTFSSPEDVPAIMPRSYGESMLYLDGKRHFDMTMSSQ